MNAVPSAAIVTLLFTDVEGSTRLWETEPAKMGEAMARHDTLARTAVVEHQGSVVKTTGDGLHAVFGEAADALRAALAIEVALADPAATAGMALHVRCGLHTGTVETRDDDYFGSAVNRAARIMMPSLLPISGNISVSGSIVTSYHFLYQAAIAFLKTGLPL